VPYSDSFNDHLINPRHAGEIPDADAVAEEVNPVCGDRLRLSVLVKDGRIVEARFLAYGCAPTLACGSALAELVSGQPVDAAKALSRADVVRGVGGLPRSKTHAAALAIETLHAALAQLG
jgi:NifU-like protein involved in Fe-S cluster formation